MLTSKKKLNRFTVFFIQNKASNPADFGEMTHVLTCRQKTRVILFIYRVAISLVPQEIQRDSHGNN